MKEDKLFIYNIFSIIFLIGIVIWIAMRLTININVNSSKAETIFHSISTTILEDIFSHTKKSSGTSNFVKLSNLALSTPSLKSVVISDSSNKIVYIFGRNHQALSYNDNGTPVQVFNRIKEKEISGFQTYNGASFHIQSVFTLFNDNLFFNTMVISLILFAGYLLLSCIMLIVLGTYRTQPTPLKTAENFSADPESYKTVGDNSFSFIKLSSELKRAASFDQDLVLVLIKADDFFLEHYKEDFTGLLHESFSYSDLIFSFDHSYFAIILPDDTIDRGIIRIREFDQASAIKFNMINLHGLYYGLSSRNGRLIEGEVLYNEAFTALKRAEKDRVSHIIGFRPDPAKYRQFLSRNKV